MTGLPFPVKFNSLVQGRAQGYKRFIDHRTVEIAQNRIESRPAPPRATGTPLAAALTAGIVAGLIPTELVAGPGRTVLLDITTLDPDEGALVARMEARPHSGVTPALVDSPGSGLPRTPST